MTNKDLKAMTLLWWNIWWGTCTSVGIFWLTGDFCNLPNLEKPKQKPQLRKYLGLTPKRVRDRKGRFDLHGSQCNVPSLDNSALSKLKRENSIVLSCSIKDFTSFSKNSFIMNCCIQTKELS